MNAKELQEVIQSQQFIREWLNKIKEDDSRIIDEIMELIKTNPEYRKFIMDYAKQVDK